MSILYARRSLHFSSINSDKKIVRMFGREQGLSFVFLLVCAGKLIDILHEQWIVR